MSWAGHVSARNRAPRPTDWATRRAQALARDGHTCRLRTPGLCTGVATEVDHVVPVARGGTDDVANLASACPPCHAVKSAAEAAAARWSPDRRRARPPERHPGLVDLGRPGR